MGWRGARVAVACALLPLAWLGTASAAAVAAPSIALRSPCAYRVFQRDDLGRASIIVAGRTHHLHGDVQIRWGSGAWMTVACRPDGVFHARLRAPFPGQAVFVVRSERRHGIRVVREAVGVGDIYVIAGQSNASGRSPLRFTSSFPGLTAAMFGNDDRWRSLRDPVDSPVRQVDSVSIDRHAGGSVWPDVAVELMAAEGVPVAYVPCSRGTTPIARWRRSSVAPWSPMTLYGSMMRRIRAVGGKVRAVLFWQGENDARYGTPPDEYEAALRRLGDDVDRDCGAPLVAVQIGDFREGLYPSASVDAIRTVQQRTWGTSNVVAGPILYDIGLGNQVHFRDADDVRAAARRWAAAVLVGVLDREEAAGPSLVGASWDGARTVTLTVDSGPMPLLVGPVDGVIVREHGEDVPVAAAAVTAADTVTLTLTEDVQGPLSVTLGSGRSAAGARVPVGSSVWRLPVAMFIDQPVSQPGE